MNNFFLFLEELKNLKQDISYAMVFLKPADRLVFILALFMIFGSGFWLACLSKFSLLFMIHVTLGLWAIEKVKLICRVQLDSRQDAIFFLPLRIKRIAFMYFLIGFLAMISSLGILFFLIYFFELNNMMRLGFYLNF